MNNVCNRIKFTIPVTPTLCIKSFGIVFSFKKALRLFSTRSRLFPDPYIPSSSQDTSHFPLHSLP